MMSGYLDRMLRPFRRPLTLTFHKGNFPGNPEMTGVLTTPQRIEPGDMDRIRAIDARKLVDGQVVKLPR